MATNRGLKTMNNNSKLKGKLFDLLLDHSGHDLDYVDCLLNSIINLVKQDITEQLKETETNV